MKLLKKILLIAGGICLAIVLATISINVYVILYAKPFIESSLENLENSSFFSDEAEYTVLVLGAQVHGTNLSRVLEDRVTTGIKCYKSGLATSLLLSGDHGKKWYDEVNAMRVYILTHYPELERKNIFLDHAGFNTYDSMYRARDVFEAKHIIIVTQRFHSYRAVYIAKKLGIDALGLSVSQNHFEKSWRISWEIREICARVKGFLETGIRRKPQFLGPAIPISGSGIETWDMDK